MDEQFAELEEPTPPSMCQRREEGFSELPRLLELGEMRSLFVP